MIKKKNFSLLYTPSTMFSSFKSITFPIISKFPTEDWLMEYDISIPLRAELLQSRALPCLPDCLLYSCHIPALPPLF